MFKLEQIQINTLGGIIACELDSLQSFRFDPMDLHRLDGFEDLEDYIFVIDANYQLQKIGVSRDSKIMN